MGWQLWCKRFLSVFTGVALCLFVAYLVKGYLLVDAIAASLLWGVITATVFVIARIIQSSKGQHCAICADTAEFHNKESK